MGVEFNFQSTGELYRGKCRIFGVENSFLSALGPKLDLFALGSYADMLANCKQKQIFKSDGFPKALLHKGCLLYTSRVHLVTGHCQQGSAKYTVG